MARQFFNTAADGNAIVTRFEFLTVADMNAFTNEQSGNPCALPSLSAVDNGSVTQVGSAAPFDYYILLDHSGPTWLKLGGGAAPMYFGAGAIGSSLATRFLYPSYSDRTAEVLASNEVPATKAGNLGTLQVLHNVVGSPTVVVTYTVLVNGTPSALAVGLAADSAFGANLATTVPIVVGDRISIRVTKPSTLGFSPRNIQVSLEAI